MNRGQLQVRFRCLTTPPGESTECNSGCRARLVVGALLETGCCCALMPQAAFTARNKRACSGSTLARRHIFLFMYGVVFTLFAIRQGLTLAKPTGGIVAIGLGLAALAWLAVRPDKPTPATAAAMTATPVVMAFHRVITAELACLIGPMFLAMYLRAFYSPRRGLILVAVLTGASVFALAVEPVPTIDYVVFVVAIVGAAESFGLVTRALVTAACTDPLQAYSTAPAGRSRQSICWRDRVRAQPRSPSSHWTSTTSNSSTTSRDTWRETSIWSVARNAGEN